MRRTKAPTVALQNRQKTLRLDLRFARQVACAVAREIRPNMGDNGAPPALRLPFPTSLVVVFVTDNEIASINTQFLNHDGPTDVITFAHGEIILSTDRAVEQAGPYRSTVPEEVVRYMVHGLLHLAGYDDTTPGARRRMHRRQEQILGDLRKKLDLKRILR